MLMLDSAYQPAACRPGKPRLRRARALTFAQLTQVADTIAHRMCRHLVRKGWLEGEDDSGFLSDRADCEDGLDALWMSSITYRIATGAQAGRKVATLQTIPVCADAPEGDAGKIGGFSLHADVAAEANESQKLERRQFSCGAISLTQWPWPLRRCALDGEWPRHSGTRLGRRCGVVQLFKPCAKVHASHPTISKFPRPPHAAAERRAVFSR